MKRFSPHSFPCLAFFALSIFHACATPPEKETQIEAMAEYTRAKMATSPKAEFKVEPFVFADAPSLPTLKESGFSEAPAFEDHFDTNWKQSRKKEWILATWEQNGTKMSPKRVFINKDGYLTQEVLAGNPPQGGSMQSKAEFSYGRWVARIKPSAVPGVLNSMFTKDWDNHKTSDSNRDGDKGEIDIEFLSSHFHGDQGAVHLAIHLKGKKPLWGTDLPLDFNPSETFHEWGFDILPDKVIWHVDGKVLFVWAYSEDYRINEDYEFFFNSWTSKNWVQGPPAENAYYEIDWVKFYPLEK